MYKSFRGQNAGGKSDWHKPAGRGSWKKPSSHGGFGQAAAYDATCAGCGKDCKVPFRPNGSKPVYCTNCFKKDGNAPEPKRFGSSRFEKPSYRDREDTRSQGSGDLREIQEQLRVVNAKLDAIIRSLDV